MNDDDDWVQRQRWEEYREREREADWNAFMRQYNKHSQGYWTLSMWAFRLGTLLGLAGLAWLIVLWVKR